MSFLKKLLGGSTYDPLAPTTHSSKPHEAANRTPFTVAEAVLPPLGARLIDRDEFDEINESRTWERMHGSTTERFEVMDDGEVQVSIDVVEPSHVRGPGILEATWSREDGSERFVVDADTPSLFMSIVDAASSTEIAQLAGALGPERADFNAFFTLELSPTGHTCLTLYLDDVLAEVTTDNVERVPQVIDALRELSRTARAAAVARIGELFAWHVGTPSFAAPTDPTAYLERARGTLDQIPGMQSKASDDPDWASWSWSDPGDTAASGEVDVHAASGAVNLSLELSVFELERDGLHLDWNWDPASATWIRDDAYGDDALLPAFLERSGHQVELTLAHLAANHAYEFSLSTDDAGSVAAVSTIVGIGEESIEQAESVFGILLTDFVTLRT